MNDDDEIKQINREYRRKVFIASLLCGLGVVWGLTKIFAVHMDIVG